MLKRLIIAWIIAVGLLFKFMPFVPLSANPQRMFFGNNLATAALAALSFDQYSDGSGGTHTTLTPTKGINVPAGSAIFAVMRAQTGTCPTYNNAGGSGHYWMTDTAGGTFLDAGCQITSGAASVQLAGYLCNSSGNTNDIIVGHLFTAQAYTYVHVAVIPNALVSNCYDVKISGAGTASTTITSGAFSTAGLNEVAVVDAADTNTLEVFAPGSGCHLQASTSADAGAGDFWGLGAMEVCPYLTQQTTVTVGMTQKTAYAYGVLGAALKVSNATLASPPAASLVTHVVSQTHYTCGSPCSNTVTIPAGPGIPVGAGAIVWAAGGGTTDSCNTSTCVLTVTDSTGSNVWTSNNYWASGFSIGQYIATSPITSPIAAGGTVVCHFYKHDGSTSIAASLTYCRLFSIPVMSSVDSIGTPATTGNMSGGALTVTAAHNDMIFSIWDLGGTVLINANPCLGYYTTLNQVDGGGGLQFAESGLSQNNTTPCAIQSGNTGVWGVGMAIKQTP